MMISISVCASASLALVIFLSSSNTLVDTTSIATGQLNVMMYCLITQYWMLRVEARDARSRAKDLVRESWDRYDSCWKDVIYDPIATETLQRIKIICDAAAKQSVSKGWYSSTPLQSFTNLDPSESSRDYAVFKKLFELADDLNTQVQEAGKRWFNEGSLFMVIQNCTCLL